MCGFDLWMLVMLRCKQAEVPAKFLGALGKAPVPIMVVKM